MAGIRHYDKNCGKKKNDKSKDTKTNNSAKSIQSPGEVGDSRYSEFYLKKSWKSTEESLGIIKDDDLCFKPGN